VNDSPNVVQPDEITVYSRELSFTHPIKSTMGMGPSEARTKRKQILRRYQQYGMTLENCTTVEGIPAADTFSVHDFWRIEVDGADAVTISANFAPRFTKRTIFKNLIEKSVLKETKAWFVGYKAMILQTMENAEGPISVPSAASSVDKLSGTDNSDICYRRMLRLLVWSVVFMVLLMIVMVLIALQIMVVLSSIQNELVALRSSNSLLFEL
jgi:VAD1 Analog of StAR-related lipid transfer domain